MHPKPHRLTFIHKDDLCDICEKKKHTHYSHIGPYENFYGWLVCDYCRKNNLDNLKKYWVKSLQNLVQDYGPLVKVRHNAGKIEDGWKFYADAVWNPEYKDYLITLTKRDLQITVTLSTIHDLN